MPRYAWKFTMGTECSYVVGFTTKSYILPKYEEYRLREAMKFWGAIVRKKKKKKNGLGKKMQSW